MVFVSGSQGSGSSRISRVATNPIHSRLGTRPGGGGGGHNKQDFRWKKNSDASGGHDDRGTASDPEQRNYANNRYRYTKKNAEIASTMRSIVSYNAHFLNFSSVLNLTLDSDE